MHCVVCLFILYSLYDNHNNDTNRSFRSGTMLTKYKVFMFTRIVLIHCIVLNCILFYICVITFVYSFNCWLLESAVPCRQALLSISTAEWFDSNKLLTYLLNVQFIGVAELTTRHTVKKRPQCILAFSQQRNVTLICRLLLTWIRDFTIMRN